MVSILRFPRSLCRNLNVFRWKLCIFFHVYKLFYKSNVGYVTIFLYWFYQKWGLRINVHIVIHWATKDVISTSTFIVSFSYNVPRIYLLTSFPGLTTTKFLSINPHPPTQLRFAQAWCCKERLLAYLKTIQHRSFLKIIYLSI